MLKVGITGGIGSGKTTVAHIFEVLGIPVFYADDAAKRLMNEDEDIKAAIIKAFGNDAYAGNLLDRKYIAKQVFNNEPKLNILNAIVHPATIRDAEQWFQLQHGDYVIKEAALIFESGSNATLDCVIGVRSPENLRIHRAMQRDDITAEQVTARINKQWNEDEKLRLCDLIIINDEQHALIPQVLDVHKKLLQLAAKK